MHRFCIKTLHSSRNYRRCRRGFTLVEILVVVSIIAVLVAILVPAIGVVRERVRAAKAMEQVAEIHMALQHYASEDSRHRYPPQSGPGDLSLRLDPDDAVMGNLNLLRRNGYEIDLSGLARDGVAPYPLCDPWKRPYSYQVDADLLSVSGVQRPMPPEVCPAWNTAGRRPWGYVWSLGAKGAADGRGWIYVRDDR
ncbi:MAG: type II secretion system protein [Planctomycetes bacterium]|nr:type II secretion system protein [Planctomycetota bacterium]